MRIDGHTHTQYCLHGTGDSAEEMVKLAMSYGVKRYTFTEHVPLPEIVAELCVHGRELVVESAMDPYRVEEYFAEMAELKEKYADRIELRVGVELDYIDGLEDEARAFLDANAARLDDVILSVHMLRYDDRLYSVDYDPELYREGLVALYGSFQKAQEAYFETLIRSVKTEWGRRGPDRIGHMTLCQKFRLSFPDEETEFSPRSLELIDTLLDELAMRGIGLDDNRAGIFNPTCRMPYVPEFIREGAQRRGIPLVFGSDSHGLEAMVQTYEAEGWKRGEDER